MSGYQAGGLAAPSPVPSSSAAATAAASPCDCEWEILRLAHLSKQYAAQAPPEPPLDAIMGGVQQQQQQGAGASDGGDGSIPVATPGSSTFLVAILTVAHDLVQHWGALNGCQNVESHISPHTLCTMTDTIGSLLRGHELAIDAANKAPFLALNHHHHQHWQQQQQQHHRPTAAAAAAPADSRATIGRLELEPGEAAIVLQESLKHSIVRLATMSQDIAEEAALLAQRNPHITHPLKDRDVRGLIARLFVALASVDRMAGVDR